MKKYEGQTFKKLFDQSSRAVIADYDFNNCIFDNCGLSLTKTVEMRSIVKNVRLTKCTSVNCGIGPAIFEEVTIDGLETNDLLIIWGPLFKHVTLKGKLGKMKINLTANFWDVRSVMQRPFDLARSQFYETVDWALDIREAQFNEFDMGGVPARLVRRDPASQVVVTREKAICTGWRERLSNSNTYWPMVIDMFLRDGEADTVLVVPHNKPKRKVATLLEQLNELRQIGVAEPD
jgi:hypothetical protein